MRYLLTLFALVFTAGILSAQVKFTSKAFENGFKYPVAVFSSDIAIQDTMNAQIESSIQDLESSDFCIGDFGYVQKGAHLQLHLMCNCIDMKESEHRYLFFNLKTGYLVRQADLFAPKERERALIYISGELKKHTATTDACKESFSSLPETISYDDIDIRIGKDGIEVRPKNSTSCEREPLRIEWKNLHSYLQFSFI